MTVRLVDCGGMKTFLPLALLLACAATAAAFALPREDDPPGPHPSLEEANWNDPGPHPSLEEAYWNNPAVERPPAFQRPSGPHPSQAFRNDPGTGRDSEGTRGPHPSLAEVFFYYETLGAADVRVSRPVWAQSTGANVQEVEFSAFGRNFAFELYPSTELFAEEFAGYAGDGEGNYRIPIPINKNEFYHGRIKGMEASVATAHIPESGIISMTFTTEDGESWSVDPSNYYFRGPHQEHMVVYCASDVKEWPKIAGDASLRGPIASAAAMNDKAFAALANGQSCSIKLIADFKLYEHFNRNFQATLNYMASAINSANHNSFRPTTWPVGGSNIGNLGMRIAYCWVWYTASQSGHYNSHDVTTSVEYRNRVARQATNTANYCLVHGLTYRTFTDRFDGYAYIGTICNPINNVAITTRLGNGYTMSDYTFKWLVTHELGHNWGAYHDHQGWRASACQQGVMSYNQKLWFSGCSKTSVGQTLQNANCFKP